MLIEMQIGTSILGKPCSKKTNPIFDITDAILQLDMLTLYQYYKHDSRQSGSYVLLSQKISSILFEFRFSCGKTLNTDHQHQSIGVSLCDWYNSEKNTVFWFDINPDN